MVSQHGILLAVGLISDHFGPLVAKVCECLLRHGALQLPEIARRLKLPRNDLKNSLFVLIQHNCVQAFSYPRPRGPGRRAVTLYLAIFDNVLHRLRFSKFLSVIRADIPESEVLIEGLLQNGRLTFDQLVERTISKVPEGTTRPEREEIRLNFNKLLYARYVERCPKPEPSFDPDEQTTPARRRVQKTVEEVLSLEQKIVNTATLSDPERFSELPYSTEDASNANDCPRNAVSAAKRKHGAFEVDEERNSTSAEHEVLWRTNFEKFIFCLKKKFCADRKKPNLKVGTHPIWESFFEANLTNKDTNSVTSSMNGILERLGQKEAGAEMTLDQITRVLEGLQCTISTDDPEAFTFDLRKMVEACRNEEIESLVKKKYGQEAFTIFRLLVTQGCPVETDQIIDTTILDKQIVHSTLYKLWKDDYVDTEKIASAPGTGYAQFFVWKVKNTFREQFIDNLYHTALNLRQMVEYIRELLLKSEVLIEGLLQNGRLTFDQLVERTISKVPEGTTRPEREEIRLNFNKLLYARYVERCPKPEPSFDPDEQTTPARRRVQKTVEEVLSLEQKIVNTATLSDPERFSELPYSTEDASNANDCPRNAVSAAKRKHGAFEVDEERNSTSAEHEVLWRTNFEKFIFCLKNKEFFYPLKPLGKESFVFMWCNQQTPGANKIL